MKHVHFISGGAGSWLASKLHMEAHALDEHIFTFTDTLYEDADCYRFLIEGVAFLVGRAVPWLPFADDFPDYRVPADTPIEAYAGNPAWRSYLATLRSRAVEAVPELEWLVEGRDVWEIFRDERFLGNSSADPCSRLAKRALRDRWLRRNFDPANTTIVVGIGDDEKHRFDNGDGGGFRPRMAANGWRAVAPLIGSREGDLGTRYAVRKAGLRLPRLYLRSYAHNNCGGFCCKAGQAHWKNRRDVDRERFDYDRMMERKIIAYLGADVSMLTDRSGDGEKKPLTLDEFDRRVAADPQLTFDWQPGDSGCGCALDEAVA